MIDTSMWLSNATIHSNTTSELNAYVNNGLSQYTLNETTSRQTEGNNRRRACGIKVINHNNTQGGAGKSVRPPQRMTIPITGGGHAHFIPNVTELRLYGAVQEGSSGIASPTGVIGIGIETLRLSSVAPENSFPTGNDAEMEIDIVIYDQEDSTKYAFLTDYAISTTGLGASWATSNTGSVLWRGALGVSSFDRSFIYHNTQSNAWHFVNWSLNEMWHDTSKWVIAYRIHSVVSPYFITNSVSTSANSLNAGIYAGVSGIDLAMSGSNPLLLSGGGFITAIGAPPAIGLTGGSTLDLDNELIVFVQTPSLEGSATLRISGGGELVTRDAMVELLGVDRLVTAGGGALGSDTNHVFLSGGNTIEGLRLEDFGRLIRDGIDDLIGSGGGFIPTVIYWRRR